MKHFQDKFVSVSKKNKKNESRIFGFTVCHEVTKKVKSAIQKKTFSEITIKVSTFKLYVMIVLGTVVDLT